MKKITVLLFTLLLANLFAGCSSFQGAQSSEVKKASRTVPLSYVNAGDNQPIQDSTGNMNTSVPGVPVLMYHHLLENRENKKFRNNADVITPETFAKQMHYLYVNHYMTVTLPDLEKYVDKKMSLPDRSVVLTFDDGYLSNFKYAYPVLKKYHMKATIFCITGQMKNKPETFNPDKLNYISWPELPKYADVFAYESHANHFHKEIGKKCYMVVKPVSEVKNEIHTLHMLMHGAYFAYPYGQYNHNLITILQNEGYRMAFTTKTGRVYPGSNKFLLDRNAVYPYTTWAQFKTLVEDPKAENGTAPTHNRHTHKHLNPSDQQAIEHKPTQQNL
ncbi:polysaccharide deacetylase family protein [Aneurinibacillus sp. Ricciae_BoGa-3]|uniref:polysaccharide deacetylase family protein n=1 Tax=Aneurinibacillus sp. Ricciae_BoGa-3 TaxID=3022697 RepID=UPI002340CD75|nr:polysaccharide deacetylase family protein [Aneurinibacillus sp. Ricciae_BoGa-3]WCK52713.1 polysaccharide deacetylase family protein [Aneurinibacillus sp. Ricciae_BoGa-3]